MEEFLGENMTSNNGLLVRQLILRVQYEFDELPEGIQNVLRKYWKVSKC